ncbi:hypothetical protein B566_EDAN007415 [Ephemera danica]|nr:hypothetical protein B566_EDAN007415 [Ephemera danica]
MDLKNEVVFQSPNPRDPSEIPEIPLGDYLMNKLRDNLPRLHGRTWMHDILGGKSVKFDEIEDLSRRFGSALTRLGFKKGDAFFFVTFESAQLFALCLTVWRLGGITRGWYQCDVKETYKIQLQQSQPKFILIDDRTAPMMLEVVNELKYSTTLLSFGDVKGTISVDQMLQDDGSAFPEHVKINPREDVVIAMDTSGSTGKPKAVLYSHYSAIAASYGGRGYFKNGNSMMSCSINFGTLAVVVCKESLCYGGTVYFNSVFNRETHFGLLRKYKPETVIMYPYNAVWMARSPELKSNDLSFLKCIHVTASVLDPATVKILNEELPNVAIEQAYGMTECLFVSTTKLGRDPKNPIIYKEKQDGKEFSVVSTGKLSPYTKAKVMDVETGRTLPVGQRGEILLDRSNIDADGWYHTGDFGFFDEDANLYIIERIYNFFKCNAEIAAGVVGIPNAATDNLARAFVVLRPGCHVTADELQAHVAARLPEYKHLHGGVRFIDVLPVNRNNKIDRGTLKKLALAEMEK